MILRALLFFGWAGCFAWAQAPAEGLVEVSGDSIPGIVIEMRYATGKNITGKKLYTDGRAWLRRETIRKLEKAVTDLRGRGYRLVLWDAWRPISAQKDLWAAKPDGKFLTPPTKISRHNRGTSVDVALADLQGKLLEMPSDHDEFSARADENFSDVPEGVGERAELLRQMMFRAGVSGVPDEWCHCDVRDCTSYDPIQER